MTSRSVHSRNVKTLDEVLTMVELGVGKIVTAMHKQRPTGALKRGRRKVKMRADAA